MSELIEIDWRGEPTRVEIERVAVGTGDGPAKAPTVVFLHEGLGSVAMWRGYPERFCHEHGLAGFVYSRPYYGRSAPPPAEAPWPPTFMHEQAFEVLPAVLAAAGIERPWLFGHSDGGSIALLYASRHPVAGLVVAAPHLFVEPLTRASIEKAEAALADGSFVARLARYHDDAAATASGWIATWLSPALAPWNIEAETARIAAGCPVLAVQGDADDYGTLAHIESIARRLPKTRLLVIPECGHSPHRDQEAVLTREAGRFILEHTAY